MLDLFKKHKGYYDPYKKMDKKPLELYLNLGKKEKSVRILYYYKWDVARLLNLFLHTHVDTTKYHPDDLDILYFNDDDSYIYKVEVREKVSKEESPS